MGMMWPYAVDGWNWLSMSVMMLLFWGGLIAFGIWAVRAFTGSRTGGDAAMDVLRRRFAAGEISQEEFDKTRKALGAH